MTAGDRTPRLLLPGLLCDDRLWRDQVTELEGIAAIQVPDLTRDDSVSAMVARVLAEAPPDQPTLIAGDDDGMTPPEESRILHAAIRNSRLHYVPSVRPLAGDELPQETTAVLRGWLTAI